VTSLDDVVSPELVLVSPPEVAAQARAALPDSAVEQTIWVSNLRAALAERELVAETVREPRLGGLVFTALMAGNCLAAILLPIVFR
jgi:hypothetical protein